jgi:hypothetical protein
MPRIPFFRLGAAPDKPELPALGTSVPAVSLTGLAVGVDNLRHDVVLSTKFADATRAQIARQIARHGEVEGLLSAEAAQSAQGPSWLRSQTRAQANLGRKRNPANGKRFWRSCTSPH